MWIRSNALIRRLPARVDGLLWPAATVALYALVPVLAWYDTVVPILTLALSLALAIALIALSEIDRTSLRLPDAITVPLLPVGILAAAVTTGETLWHIFSAGLGFAFILLVDYAYRAWRGHSGIGLGDAKLFGASGAWVGAQALPTVLLWACSAALIGLLLAHALRCALEARDPIPFGSFLALGTWLVWCLGPLL